MSSATWVIPPQREPGGRTAVPGVPVIYTDSLLESLDDKDDPQTQSPLFCVVPAEIRDSIFELALTAYDDLSAPYPVHTHYSRPGYRYKHRIHTTMLQTCRRVYKETHDLPVKLNEHVFWCRAPSGPPVRHCDDPMAYFFSMTTQQRAAVESIHLFTSQAWLEGTFPLVFEGMANLPGFRPKHLTITVRHGDWWFWGSPMMEGPLRFNRGWTESLSRVHGLWTLKVELESIETDNAQLEIIQRDLRSWRIDAGNGKIFSIKDVEQIPPSTYEGPTIFVDESMLYDPGDGIWKWISPDDPEVQKKAKYTIHTTRWAVSNFNRTRAQAKPIDPEQSMTVCKPAFKALSLATVVPLLDLPNAAYTQRALDSSLILDWVAGKA